MKFTALVLAADREALNPVAHAAGTPCKSLVPLQGKPLVRRVLETLARCPSVERCLLLGPPQEILAHTELASLLGSPWLTWMPHQPSPSLSVLAGFSRVPENQPVLLTTSDLAFPNVQTFEDFCRQASVSGADAAVGLVPTAQVVSCFPEFQRTRLKFADGPFCTCNLFAFLTPQGKKLAELWRHLEQERKHPWRLIRELGILSLAYYLLGRLSSDELARQVEKKSGVKVKFVILPYPEAAIDIDTEDDLRQVQKLLEKGLIS
jgi:CTP:molybdopterin cytidylyltransferase MocA